MAVFLEIIENDIRHHADAAGIVVPDKAIKGLYDVCVTGKDKFNLDFIYNGKKYIFKVTRLSIKRFVGVRIVDKITNRRVIYLNINCY